MKTFLLLLLIVPTLLWSVAKDECYIGIFLENLPLSLLKEYGVDYGVRITDVAANSPASAAGIAKGTLLLQIDDYNIISDIQVKEILNLMRPGQKVVLTVVHKNDRQQIPIVLGSRREYFSAPKPFTFDWAAKLDIGIKMQDINPQLKQYFEVKNGVLVAEVLKNSPADKAGVRAGDIIVRVDKRQINRINDVKDVLKNRKAGASPSFFISRKGSEKKIKITLLKPETPYRSYYFEFDENNRVVLYGPDQQQAAILDLDTVSEWIRLNIEQEANQLDRDEVRDRIELLQKEINHLKSNLNIK